MGRERKRWWMAAFMALGLTGCAGGRPIVTASGADCAGLVPSDWRHGVAGADLPPDEAVVADWIAFGDAQTGRLDMANGRLADAMTIVETCEANGRAAVRKAGRGGLLRWLGL